MSSLETFLSAAVILLPLVYLLTALVYGWVFFAGNQRADRLASPLLLGSLAFHLAYLAALTARWDQFPVADISQALSLVAFAVGVTYVMVEWRGRERSTGFWIVSVMFFIELLSSILRNPDGIAHSELLKNGVFATHAFLALVAYAAFVMAAAYGFLFLRLYRELKSGLFALFYGKLPPLSVLERMMSGALHVGFGALTAAVVLGVVNAYRLYGESWVSDPMILLTLATWALYGLALILRKAQQWQGRQTAIVSIAGLCAILASLVIVNFVVGDFHSLGPT